MSDEATRDIDPTRARILDATSIAVAQYGARKVNLSEIAVLAGVSRPTLYKHFGSKDALLLAVSEHEKARFESNFVSAVRGLHGVERLERAIRFMIDFQQDHPMRGLVVLEPAFMINQLRRNLRTMRVGLIPIFEELAGELGIERSRAMDLADLTVRTALSHFLIEGDHEGQLAWDLRHVSGLDRLQRG